MNDESIPAPLFAEDHPPIIRVTSLQFAAEENLPVILVNFFLDRLGAELTRQLHALNYYARSRLDLISDAEINERSIHKDARKSRTGSGIAWERQQSYLLHKRSFSPNEKIRTGIGPEQTIKSYILEAAQQARVRGQKVELTTGEVIRYLRLQQNLTIAELQNALEEYEDALPANIVSKFDDRHERQKGQAFAHTYLQTVERNKIPISDQRLLNIMQILSAQPADIQAVIAWRVKPKIQELTEAKTYSQCLARSCKLKWSSLGNLVDALNAINPAATPFTKKYVGNVFRGEAKPSLRLHETCLELFKRNDIDEHFTTGFTQLQKQSKAFFRKLILSSRDFAECVILCQLALNISTGELTEQLGLANKGTVLAWKNGTFAPNRPKLLQRMIDLVGMDPQTADKFWQLNKEKLQTLKQDPKPKPDIRKSIDAFKFTSISADTIFLPTSVAELTAAVSRSARLRHE